MTRFPLLPLHELIAPGQEPSVRAYSETVLAVYITAHGLGHAARTCDVLSAFSELYPHIPITVVSELPEWFLVSRNLKFSERKACFDVGMVQRDAVQMDIATTLTRLQRLMADWDSLVSQESKWMLESKVKLVVSDIPAIPLEAAASAGVTSAALTSFSWDWIYGAFQSQSPNWRAIIQRFQKAYQLCPLLLRYPFSGPMPFFSRTEDVPLVASPGDNKKGLFAELTGADAKKPWILFCLNSFQFQNPSCFDAFGNYQFLTAGKLNWTSPNCFSLNPKTFNFSALVASCDAVLSKPGFGVLSDCVANNKPLIYVEREDFLEYTILERGIQEHLSGVHLPLSNLVSGDLQPALDALESGLAPPKSPLQCDGAVKVAHRLHHLYSTSS